MLCPWFSELIRAGFSLKHAAQKRARSHYEANHINESLIGILQNDGLAHGRLPLLQAGRTDELIDKLMDTAILILKQHDPYTMARSCAIQRG